MRSIATEWQKKGSEGNSSFFRIRLVSGV